MKCQLCGGNLKVLSSRHQLSGRIRRRRKCLSCGDRTTTYEITPAELKDFKKLKKLIDEMNWLSKGLTEKFNAINQLATDFAEFED